LPDLFLKNSAAGFDRADLLRDRRGDPVIERHAIFLGEPLVFSSMR
jgi:hypothetical protein